MTKRPKTTPFVRRFTPTTAFAALERAVQREVAAAQRRAAAALAVLHAVADLAVAGTVDSSALDVLRQVELVAEACNWPTHGDDAVASLLDAGRGRVALARGQFLEVREAAALAGRSRVSARRATEAAKTRADQLAWILRSPHRVSGLPGADASRTAQEAQEGAEGTEDGSESIPATEDAQNRPRIDPAAEGGTP